MHKHPALLFVFYLSFCSFLKQHLLSTRLVLGSQLYSLRITFSSNIERETGNKVDKN